MVSLVCLIATFFPIRVFIKQGHINKLKINVTYKL